MAGRASTFSPHYTPSSLPPSLQMIFSQRFPCGKAGYDGEREGINYSASTTNRPTDRELCHSFFLSCRLSLPLSLRPSFLGRLGEILWPIPGGSRGKQSSAVQRGVKQCFCCCVLIKPVNGSLMSLCHRERERERGSGEGERKRGRKTEPHKTLHECE